MKILNFGSLNIDFVYKVDHHVKSGETLSSYSLEKFCGGKGLNQSVALAKAGAEVYHAGLIGSDGVMLKELLEQSGVNCSLLQTTQDASGHAIIQVDKNGENCILLYGGANQQITSEYIDKVLSYFEKGDLLLLQNEINKLDEIINKAADRDMIIALNPSPINEEIAALPFDKITYFILNEIEGKAVSGESKPEAMIRTLQKNYKNSRIVLTLGSKGSIYADSNTFAEQGIYEVDAVDTTAAGDTFTGYFLSLVMEGKLPELALNTAAKASALAVSKLGAANSIPYRIDVEQAELKLQV